MIFAVISFSQWIDHITHSFQTRCDEIRGRPIIMTLEAGSFRQMPYAAHFRIGSMCSYKVAKHVLPKKT